MIAQQLKWHAILKLKSGTPIHIGSARFPADLWAMKVQDFTELKRDQFDSAVLLAIDSEKRVSAAHPLFRLSPFNCVTVLVGTTEFGDILIQRDLERKL